LISVELSTFRNIGIEADDGEIGSLQCPVDVGLSHCMTGSIASFGGESESLRTEVFDKGIKGLSLIRKRISIMIAWNGKDGSIIVQVGIVELFVVFGGFTIEIHHIAQVVEESSLSAVQVIDHMHGDDMLAGPIDHPTSITNSVKNKAFSSVVLLGQDLVK